MLIIPLTIVHLEILFENTVATLSLALISRSALYLLGCFLGGLLFDRVGWKELQLSVTLLFRAVAIAVSPFFSVYWFIAVWSIFGLLMGYGETGKKSCIVIRDVTRQWLWNRREASGAIASLIVVTHGAI